MHESEKVKVKSLSRLRLLATPWTAAYQAPLSMGFSRQEYWNGVPLPSPNVNYTYKVFKIQRTANLLGLATLQVLWSHTWLMATRLDSTGIKRTHGDEILFLCTLTPSWFPEAALVLTAVVFLFLVQIYVCQSCFISFQTVQSTQHLGAEVCLVLPI